MQPPLSKNNDLRFAIITLLPTVRIAAADTGTPLRRKFVTVSITFFKLSGSNVGQPVFFFAISVVSLSAASYFFQFQES